MAKTAATAATIPPAQADLVEKAVAAVEGKDLAAALVANQATRNMKAKTRADQAVLAAQAVNPVAQVVAPTVLEATAAAAEAV
jgi:hypothetical protein